MRKRKWLFGLAAGLSILLLGAADGWTKGKPGGGGGGGTPPAGIIYGDGEAIDAAGNVLDTGLPTGWPSYDRHGGARWFAWYKDNGALAVHGGSDNSLIATNEGGTEVEIFAPTQSGNDETTIHYDLIRWAHDDSAIYFVAVVWTGSGQFDAESHVYRLALDWGTGSPVADGAPVSVKQMGVTTDGGPYPLFGQFDVSPAEDKLVYEDNINSSSRNIYVEDLASGTSTLLASAPVQDPNWSPDGTRIAYQVSNGTGLVTVDPDGSGATLFQPTKGNRVYRGPRWSPDGAHLAFAERSGRLLSTLHTGRIELATGAVTILDADVTPTGWRNS